MLNIFLCSGVKRRLTGICAFAVICLLFMLISSKTVWAETPKAVLDAKEAVVLVRSYDQNSNNQGMECAGFFIGKDGDMVDHIITAASVADHNPDSIQVFVDNQGINASIDDFNSPGIFYRILVLDRPVKRKSLSLRPMFSQGEKPQSVEGIDVYAIGFGGGASNDIGGYDTPLGSDKLSVTSGNVSRLETGKDMVYLNSAPCNPMFLGGPLLDKDGYVIGVNQGTGSQTDGYKALAVDAVVDQLKLIGTITYETYGKAAAKASATASASSETAASSESASASTEDSSGSSSSSIVEADDPWYITTFNNYKPQIIIIGSGAALIIILLAYYLRGAKKAQPMNKDTSGRPRPPVPPPAKQGMNKADPYRGTFVISDAEQSSKPAPPPPPQAQKLTLTLRGIAGYFAGQSIPVRQSERLVIGRDDISCNLPYPKDYTLISGIHCKISFNKEKNKFVLEDEGSTNGTFLGNGIKLKSLDEVTLENGAEFYLASPDDRFIAQIGTEPGV